MGILAPKETYKKIGLIPYQLEDIQIEKYISIAYEFLKDGHPATSLQIAQNFWAGKKNFRTQVNDLLKKSYEVLGRKKLIPLLEVAIASREVFDKANQEREKRLFLRIEEFKVGMKVRLTSSLERFYPLKEKV
ncbi:MAG: hypothetical protein SFU98_17330 [Leptospiraceae bacterium]|nr:hypothetical protein [Leptospiraceae bacterium]